MANSPPCRRCPEVSPEEGSGGWPGLQPALQQGRVEVAELGLRSEQRAQGWRREHAPPALHRQGPPPPPRPRHVTEEHWCFLGPRVSDAGRQRLRRVKSKALREGKATCICTWGVLLGSPSTGHWKRPSVPAPNTLLGPESPRFLFPAAETSGLPRKGRECFTTRSERRQRASGWRLLRKPTRAQGTCAC